MERIRRRRKRMMRLISVAFLMIAAAVILLGFRVRTVVVTGNTRHTGQEIASGLSHDFLTQNTLYLLWKYRKEDIPEALPYLNVMKIKMQSPSRIEVTVTEKEPVGYLDKESNIYFDKDGMVLEISDEVYEDVPVVTGVSAGEAVLYQRVPTDSSAQLRTILSLTQLLSYQELRAKEIRFGENMDITVTIGSVDAVLGQDEYLEEKIANLRAILDSMDGRAGTLHMENFTGKNEPVTFTNSDGTEETNPGSSEGNSSGDENGTGDGNAAGGEGDDSSGDGAGADDGTVSGEDGAGSTGEGAAQGEDGTVDEGAAQAGEGSGEAGTPEEEQPQSTTFMVFNSSGTLVYDAHVVNGVVVDGNGNPIDGCSVNEDGNAVDAYWNVIDPATGQLVQ